MGWGWNGLCNEIIYPYERIQAAEKLLALVRLGDGAHADFPRPALAPRHLGPECPRHNLMPVADADDPDPVLRQHFFDEIDQADDPGIVVEGVESCAGEKPGAKRNPLARVSPLGRLQTHPPLSTAFFFFYSNQQAWRSDVRLPVIKIASMSSSFG